MITVFISNPHIVSHTFTLNCTTIGLCLEFDSRPYTVGLVLGWATVCVWANHLGNVSSHLHQLKGWTWEPGNSSYLVFAAIAYMASLPGVM